MKTIVQLFFSDVSLGIEGGREKVFAQMSNLAIEHNYKVIDICNGSDNEEKLFFALNKKVEFHNLRLGKIKVPFYKKMIREIAKAVHLDTKNYVDMHRTKILVKHVNNILKDRDIDIILCYEFNSVMVANFLNHTVPKVAMVHSGVEIEFGQKTKNQIMQANKIDVYQVLTPNTIQEVRKYLDTRVVCIPNIVSQVDCGTLVKQAKEKKVIINIGRIVRDKQQHFLIEAFAKIASDLQDEWEIYFYGTEQDKKYKQEMEYFIKIHGLSNKIFFKGVTTEPLKQMQNADIFGFPSKSESFGLALAEAMSVGLPVIGLKNTAAVNELILDGKNGFLCENIDDFTDKLELLMKDDVLRRQMGLNAHLQIKDYSPNKVWAKWEKLFDELSK
ncbi:MAG: glycosyltransferase [Campylobacteraceae bacterium]|jgi:glycosyltransferase involved in cell wall biosynthesis|nr:glycosyltransferase [Campylobacteraceae bacterium]